MSLVAAVAAAVVGFIGSGIYYTAFRGPLEAAKPGVPAPTAGPWIYGAEFVRTLVIAAVVAAIASTSEIGSWSGGLALGLALWVGFPLVLWVGAILHEGTSFPLAAIHAGDWLFKLAIIGVIVGAWI